MEDNLIVELYWKRDEAAIRETESKYSRYLMKIACNILSSAEDGQESVNDTYMKAWSTMPTNRPCALGAYLGRITRQLSIDRWRRRNAEKRRLGEYALSLDELSECVGGGAAAEDGAELGQLTDAINRFLGTLSDRQRDVFVCRYFFTDSISDISRYTGISENNVKSMLFRARAGLRELLEKEGYSI